MGQLTKKGKPIKVPSAKPCLQCGVPFIRKGPGGRYAHGAKYCTDCLPSGSDSGMKWRQTIMLYGVDKRMFDAMYFEQDGKCIICDEREATCIDHCHDTNRVRGLLCLGCNTLLGFIETKGRLEAALNYKADGVY